VNKSISNFSVVDRLNVNAEEISDKQEKLNNKATNSSRMEVKMGIKS
jgi:hypothetical protein